MSRRTPRLPILAAALAATALVAPAAQAAFPGTNGAIAYSHWQEPFSDLEADPDSESLEVRTVAPGTSTHVSLPDTRKASEASPAYSPDGTQIAWAVIAETRKTAGIYVGPASGGVGRRIVAGTDVTEPSWTADGKRVAFASETRGVQVVSSTGGKSATLIGRRRGWIPSAATFSADGTRMAFAWYETSSADSDIEVAEVWTAGADGSGARRILGGRRSKGPLKRASEPDFSPDGKSLAVVSQAREAFGRNAIYVTDASGKNPRKIATAPRNYSFGDAIWSPDGLQLLASRIRFGGLSEDASGLKVSSTLLTIDPVTRAQTVRLRVPSSLGFGVAWQPVPVAAPVA